MGNVFVRPAVLRDVPSLAERMRPGDRLEVWASFRWDPEEAFLNSYKSSDYCRTLVDGETPVAMFGTSPLRPMAPGAVVWLLGTDGIEKVKREFARLTISCLEEMMTIHPFLYNFVDSRYAAAVRWMQWAGAKVGAAMPYGPDGVPFHHISFDRRTWSWARRG